MRTSSEILNLVLDIGSKFDNIRLVFLGGSRANPNIFPDKYQDYNFTFIVTSVTEFIKNQSWIDSLGTPMIAKKPIVGSYRWSPDTSVFDKNQWSFIYPDLNRINIIMVSVKELESDYDVDSTTIVLLDKDGYTSKLPVPTEQDFYILLPNEEEFQDCCHRFWISLNQVYRGMKREQIIYSINLYYSQVHKILHQMLYWWVASAESDDANPGQYGRHLEKYLPNFAYLLLLKSYPQPETNSFWKAIFNCCELFKWAASEVSEILDYDYYLEEEVFSLEYLFEDITNKNK